MPNFALIPGGATVITVVADGVPAMPAVHGYPEMVHKLETATGGAPVERQIETGRRGTNQVTDHAVALPARLTLTGWVSDFDGGDRPREAWEEIRRLHKKSEPLAVLTEWGAYPEMLIRRAEAPQTGRGMRFVLDLEEILRVGVDDADLPAGNLSGPAAGRSGEVHRGRVRLDPPSL